MTKQKINLIIPAAGEATRLRPLSSNTSKVMVRVNGKTCLDYIIEQARKYADVQSIVITQGKLNDIHEYCKIKYPKDVSIVTQEQLNGPHEAIRLALKYLDFSTDHDESLPVVIWLGDAIILDENLPLGDDFLLTKQVSDHFNWCMWDGSKFYNKPTKNITNGVALVGLYSFSNGVDTIDAFRETCDSYEISDALEKYLEKNHKFENIPTNQWYDIGSIRSYHETCSALLNRKSRVFNNVEYDKNLGIIRKYPDYHDDFSIQTLQNEKLWYSKLSLEQKCFTPQIFNSDNKFELMMSYESGDILSDYMLYENLAESAWEYILEKLFRIKMNYFSNRVIGDSWGFVEQFEDHSDIMWVKKTRDRLENTVDLFNQSEIDTIIKLAEHVKKATYPVAIMHGDLHFGNVLYNCQNDRMIFIDPRGKYGMFEGTCGDQLYDWCKLAHDLYYGYNAIVANVSKNILVKKLFLEMLHRYNLPVDLILDGGLVLLATCIPLHYDDPSRQQRLVETVKTYLKERS